VLTRFASIDVGSNAMRCLVVEVDGDGGRRILESVRAPVRLGSHVFLTGRIGPVSQAQALEAFRLFRRLIDKHEVENVRAIATSAMREAADGAELAELIRNETGIVVTVIDGAEEAHLVRRAVASTLDLSKGRTAAVDVGGGSVEILVMEDGAIVRAESFTVGAVRLLEALPGGTGESDDDFFHLLSDYIGAFRTRIQAAIGKKKVHLFAATGGSIGALADLGGTVARGKRVLAEGVRVLEVNDLRDWVVKLAGHSFHERVEKFGLREDRADVILPAGVVYLRVAEILSVDRVYVPDVGLKDGLMLDLIDDLAHRGAFEDRRREVRASALALGRRFGFEEPHARKVAELALTMFDRLPDLHGLDDGDRTLLETAAILHDVGTVISLSRHHKHSYYLISESDIVGLDRRQREIVANVARYHRKRHPTTKHWHFEQLTPEERVRVTKMAALLRAADVLDREHRQQVRAVGVRREEDAIHLEPDAAGELLLERWAAEKKFLLFEETFGIRLVMD